MDTLTLALCATAQYFVLNFADFEECHRMILHISTFSLSNLFDLSIKGFFYHSIISWFQGTKNHENIKLAYDKLSNH